jgi:hypothetical protein
MDRRHAYLRAGPRGRYRAALRSRAVTLLAELNAFYTDHRLCGELDAGVECEVVMRGSIDPAGTPGPAHSHGRARAGECQAMGAR